VRAKGFTHGTHREVAPAETLARIEPHLAEFGVTQCSEITWLDRVGIPVYAALRARALIPEAEYSCGKGLTGVAARVSCLMEAIEMAHWDTPPSNLKRASLAELARDGETAAQPSRLPNFVGSSWFDDDRVVEWVEGVALRTGQRVWVPAAASYVVEHPHLFLSETHGLASGNSLLEATLHGLYEILERRLLSKAIDEGAALEVVDLSSIQDDSIKDLLQRIREAQLKLVLLSPSRRTPLPVFMAFLVDPNPLAATARVHRGAGAHLSRSVAVSRAITEAVQSRVVYLIAPDKYLSHSLSERARVEELLSTAEPNSEWCDFPDRAEPALSLDYQRAMECMEAVQLTRIYRVDMTRRPGIHVVRMVVEGATYNTDLF
jgi:ribosomal protein S12 methylthiotransferase accessory factor